MAWFPCECCGSNNCQTPYCGTVCVGKTPCTTRLVISGNHPADLRYPINYEQDGSCALSGSASLDYNSILNVGHTYLRRWTGSVRYWDRMVKKDYICCEEFGFPPTQTPYLFADVQADGSFVQSYCQRADLRYGDLYVEVRPDRVPVNGVLTCGVWVGAILKFKRKLFSDTNTCKYERLAVDYHQTPCAVGVFQDQQKTCSYCETGTNGTRTYPFNPGTDYSQTPYPSEPACSVPTDEEWNILGNYQEYCIQRSKFFPNSTDVLCSPRTVTLGPTDKDVFMGNRGCNTPDPDPVYYEKETVYDIACSNQAYCDKPAINVPKYGQWSYAPGGAGAPTSIPNFGFGVYGAGAVAPTCTGNNMTYPYNSLVCNDLFEQVSRQRGYTEVGGLADNTLLYGEALDTWVLHLECLG